MQSTPTCGKRLSSKDIALELELKLALVLEPWSWMMQGSKQQKGSDKT